MSVTTGITTVELCHRIGRRSKSGDFTKLTLSGQVDLLQAATAALQRLYNALPTYFKEQTEGFALPGPIAITAVTVTQFSKVVAGLNATDAQIGQTVVLDGDPQWNQILGPNLLQQPYMGESAIVAGTIYGNAVHSTTYPLSNIVGNPTFTDQGAAGLLPMQMVVMNNQQDAAWVWQQNVGRPYSWWPQFLGNAQGNKPLMVVRFAPAPDRAYAIKMRIAFWPKRLTVQDYTDNTPLFVPDQFIESSLIKMAIQEFKSSPEFLKSEDDKDVDVQGAAGELFAKMQPQQMAAPANRVFCPPGF